MTYKEANLAITQELSEVIQLHNQAHAKLEKYRKAYPYLMAPNLAAMMDKLRLKAPERKISAEVDSLDDALLVAEAGIDIVQCEKFDCETLAATVGAVRALRDNIVILAAGGVNGDNAARQKSYDWCREKRDGFIETIMTANQQAFAKHAADVAQEEVAA